MKPEAVALQFVAAINSGDVDRLANLMTEDHTFVDSDGSEHPGREGMRVGWRDYYEIVPDFQIRVTDIFAAGPVVGLFGTAEGTFPEDGTLKRENHWRVPAAWRAVISGDLVSRWQLYVNPESMAAIFNRVSESRARHGRTSTQE